MLHTTNQERVGTYERDHRSKNPHLRQLEYSWFMCLPKPMELDGTSRKMRKVGGLPPLFLQEGRSFHRSFAGKAASASPGLQRQLMIPVAVGC